MKADRLVIRCPDDMHVHLREGSMLRAVARHTAEVFRRALVMPNLKQPITTAALAGKYYDEIRYALREAADDEFAFFEPLMTLKLTQGTTPATIAETKDHGYIKAVKLYPEGVTTNSEDGVCDVDALGDTFKAMSDAGLVLCIHAEESGVFSMDREAAYLGRVGKIAREHPDLKIVVEHVSTLAAVLFVKDAGLNVAATITAHHLLLTLDDVVGDKLSPHNFCKPIAKRPVDRDALIEAATSCNPKFFFGSDSAPHSRGTKECASGCAGCYTAPIAMELLAQVFDAQGRLDKLEAFTSEHGARFYGLGLNEGPIVIDRAERIVPGSYSYDGAIEVPKLGLDTDIFGGVVPFKAGAKLGWRVER